MISTAYSLDQFASDMQELVSARHDRKRMFEKGAAYLERFVRNPRSVPEQFRRPCGRGAKPNHGSYVLHRGNDLFITSAVWGSGDGVPPHDHRTWGLIGVMENAIQETRFRRVDDRRREDFAKLEKAGMKLVKPGEVSVLVPDEDEIHEMNNFSDRVTVEVHVYGRDLAGLERHNYDLATGKVVKFRKVDYDNC